MRRAFASILAVALASLARLVVGGTVQYLDEPSTEQRIYIANHSSHLDFIVLWAYLPASVRARTRPVAARDYWTKGKLRLYIATTVFRALLIDRGGGAKGSRKPGTAPSHDAIDTMADVLDQGDSLILFPEGTRGDGHAIAPFRSGLYHLCLRYPSVGVVPVRLDNLNRILPKGHVIPIPMVSRLVVGRPLMISKDEERDVFLARAKEALEALAS